MFATPHHHPLVRALSRPFIGSVRRLAGSSSDEWARFSGHAKFIAGAETIESIPKLTGLPEIIVTGRANVGKSSLLNAIAGRNDLVHSSKKAGRTRALNFFAIGPSPNGRLVLVDSPGYGQVSKQEWGELFNNYIETREQLKRVYVILNCKHGIGKTDTLILQQLDRLIKSGTVQWTYQAIFTQVDRVTAQPAKTLPELRATLWKVAPTCLPAIFTAAVKPRVGIEAVRGSILEACSLASLR